MAGDPFEKASLTFEILKRVCASLKPEKGFKTQDGFFEGFKFFMQGRIKKGRGKKIP